VIDVTVTVKAKYRGVVDPDWEPDVYE